MSIVIFVIIGLLVGEAGYLLLERQGLFSLRYLMIGILLATVIGLFTSLISHGFSGLGTVYPGPAALAIIAAAAGVSMVKLSNRPLNQAGKASVPWTDDEDEDDSEEPAEDDEDDK